MKADTLSGLIAEDILRRGDRKEIKRDLGFITQVFKDNAPVVEMCRYYDAVIDLIEVNKKIEQERHKRS